ncbi:Reverse transcriptase [Phytophthora palmivora]|uniref:Reverse transcriptase n=1 Tax=Phytophthora palmivora TaxID=4796 RepID=A0A2P4XZQ9_9STRA|nr:Reverse transcriptase [Phytophthora palmivora]
MSGCMLYCTLDLVDGFYWNLIRVEGGQTAMEVHLKHLHRVLEVMRANKLYDNIDKDLRLSCQQSRCTCRSREGHSDSANPKNSGRAQGMLNLFDPCRIS